jgi:hypothetical protein
MFLGAALGDFEVWTTCNAHVLKNVKMVSPKTEAPMVSMGVRMLWS